MYQLGHYGISLLLYAPVALALRAAGLEGLLLPAAALLVGLSTLPDADEFTDRLPHRGVTHTVWFALLVGGVVAMGATVAWALAGVGSPAGALALGFVGALAIVGHLAGDIVTPMGVRPFAPLSDWHHSFDLTPAKNPTANYLLFGAGIAATLLVFTIGA